VARLGLAWLFESSAVSGKTALYQEAENGHEAVVQLLLKHMADVDAKGTMGGRPLHWAAENEHEAVAQLLLKHMVDVDAKDDHG
jgi:ankyrin repeat protein